MSDSECAHMRSRAGVPLTVVNLSSFHYSELYDFAHTQLFLIYQNRSSHGLTEKLLSLPSIRYAYMLTPRSPHNVPVPQSERGNTQDKKHGSSGYKPPATTQWYCVIFHFCELHCVPIASSVGTWDVHIWNGHIDTFQQFKSTVNKEKGYNRSWGGIRMPTRIVKDFLTDLSIMSKGGMSVVLDCTCTMESSFFPKEMAMLDSDACRWTPTPGCVYTSLQKWF